MAAHIVGYIGKIGDEEYKQKKEEGYGASDYLGRAGVEYTLENYLRGKNGKKQIDMSVDGTIEAEEVVQEAVSGKTIELTIDNVSETDPNKWLGVFKDVPTFKDGKEYSL